MELIYANDNCTGCNKCVRDCPVLIANVATDAGKVTVDSENVLHVGHVLMHVSIMPENIRMTQNHFLQH